MSGTLFLLGAVMAAESRVPTITPSEFSVDVAASYVWVLLAEPQVVALLLSALGGAVGLILRNSHIKKWRMGRAVEFLAAGVRETYEEYVRLTQKAHADGKLTSVERDMAMQKAIEKARAYCKQNGFELFKLYAKEFVPVIVEKIIGTQKAAGRAQFPFPLPELEPR